MTFKFHTKPFEHQRSTFEAIKDEEAFAIFWEQGTGKSKLAIDKCAYLYEKGEIDSVLVIAPNGVHINWITDEIPRHLAPMDGLKTISYLSKKIGTQKHLRPVMDVIKNPGFSWLAMSYDALVTDKGKKYAAMFLKSRKCMMIIDEATRIKTPGAKRTRTVLTAAKHAKYRLMLTGTPVANGPLDLYSLMRYIEPDFWKPHHLSTYTAFKHYFGVWKKQVAQGRHFEILVAYRNVDELYHMIQWCSHRVLKEDVLDLPPKLYSNHYVEMTPAQKALYETMKDEFMVWLDSGELVTAPLAIVRMLRLQQITCGYIPWDNAEQGEVKLIGDKNPRLDALLQICEDLPHQAIIWARFRKDIDLITEALGDECVRYDGSTSDEERIWARDTFQDGGRKFFVANPAAAGEGLTLHSAKSVVYYNNSFKLQDRLQSEDRAHRIGQDQSVHYIDLVSPDTIDQHISSALRRKLNISAQILGDKLKEWI